MNQYKKIRILLQKGVEKGIFPGAVLIAGSRKDIFIHCSVGYLQRIPYSIPMRKDTIFDLASLTKPLSTSLVAMKLLQEKRISLDLSISEIIPVPEDKRDITFRMLLSHSSGLPSWKPYYIELSKYPLKIRKKIIVDWILKEKLLFYPGSKEEYSDLGFILLSYLFEKITGRHIKEIAEEIYRLLGLSYTFLGISKKKVKREDFSATELCKWRKRIIQGEVHDENAFSLGGYSGHAGLFSTAKEVYSLCSILLDHYEGKRSDIFKPEIVREFFKKQNNRWTLGWDTPTKDSSSGRLFSRNSIGHLGFTGTSVWMDLDRKIIVVFLTNRIHPSRENQRIKTFRPLLHDEIIKGI